MKNLNETLSIKSPINQLTLYGYKHYFTLFSQLYNNNKLPNTILLSGPKGLGKATFAYHFINYILSQEENNKYLMDKFTIDDDSKIYKGICNNTNPNFALLDNNDTDEDIKIEKVRNIIKFVNKTAYLSNLKIILIDNTEYLNLNSSNSLLKVLEEANDKTFFFIIHNNSDKILRTIKSRCVEFKIFFNLAEKVSIFKNISTEYKEFSKINNIDKILYSETPGNVLKYLLMLNDHSLRFQDDKISCIFYLIEKYKKNKDIRLLDFISFFIEYFYNDLSQRNIKNLHIYSSNKYKLLKNINDYKKFNLDKNNLSTLLTETILNE
tara:strand:- start:4368 stop:5336 length:969 start_codon:yes stop_codon:yes gene_type:complete